MLFMFMAVKYLCCCPGDIDKLWSDSWLVASDRFLSKGRTLCFSPAAPSGGWSEKLHFSISSVPINQNQKQMNNKSKTGLFKHKALKKGLLFFKNCSQPLVHDYPVRKPNEKEEYESKILLHLT